MSIDTRAERASRVQDTFTRFRDTYGAGLAEFARLISNSDAALLVAISRKAPRLLNFINADYGLPPVPLHHCVTEKALPFISRQDLAGQKALLVDDTLIWGSTFAGVAHRLEDAGAQLDEVVLARSRSASPSMLERVDAPLTLSESEMHGFIDLEIQAFGSLGIPYDIDHPILNLQVQDFEDIVDAVQHRYNAVETTRRWQLAHGVRTFSVPVGKSVRILHSQRARQYGPAKLRLFVNERARSVKAVAIYCLAIGDRDLENPGLFERASSRLSSAWNKLQTAVVDSAFSREDQLRALAYGAHYLAGIELAGLWTAVNADFLAVGGPSVNIDDVRLLFGPRLAPPMVEIVNDHLAAISVPTLAVEAEVADTTSPLNAASEIAALAMDDKGRALMTVASRYVAATAAYDYRAMLSAVFEAQRRVFDDATRDRHKIDEARLDVGIPFAVVPELLRATAVSIRDGDFDTWCDTAVDGGTIVPKYARSLSNPTLWIRSVRFGERNDDNLRYWLHRTMSSIVNSWKRTHPNPANPEAVPWLLAEKAIAAVTAVLGPRLVNALHADLELGFDEFGARTVYDEPARGKYLIDWAVESRLLERYSGRTRRANGRTGVGSLVAPAQEFFDLHPDGNGGGSEATGGRLDIPLSLHYPASQVAPDITEVSERVAEAFVLIDAAFEGDERKRIMLALTTCPTEAAYLSSVSKELDLWVNHREANASRIASDLFRLAGTDASRQRALAEDLSRVLANSATILHETAVKRDAFHQREWVRSRLDTLFAPRGQLGHIAGVWGDYLRPLIDPSPQDMATDERYLRFAAAIASRANSFARTVLSTGGWAHDARPQEAQKSLADLADEYNVVLEQAIQAELNCYVPPRIEVDPSWSPSEACRAAARIIEDARGSVMSVLAAWRHPRDSHRMELFERDMAVLFWDVTGSSGQQELRPGQEAVHAANERLGGILRELGVEGFQPSQDDGNVCLVPTVSDAIRVFQALAETFNAHGEDIKASIETTYGFEKLSRNTVTGAYAGRVYQVGARLLTFFKEAPEQSNIRYVDPSGGTLTIMKPNGTYVLVSDHAMRVLGEIEHCQVPTSLHLVGTGSNYVIRATSVLPATVHCFARVAPSSEVS